MLETFFNMKLPSFARWLGLLLMVVFVSAIFAGAVLRYGFDLGFVKLEDFIGFAFGVLVPFCVLYAFIEDKHVRVNLFSLFKSVKTHPVYKVFNAFAYIVIAFLSLSTVWFSWSILESSKEPDGLGGLFLIKTMLPISFFLIGCVLLFAKPKPTLDKSHQTHDA